MDWSKAKSTLIIALLITNVILFGFNLYNYNLTYDSSSSRHFANEAKEILSKQNIKIDTNIPRYRNKLHTLRIEFDNFDINDLNERFFNSKGHIENPSTDFSRIDYNKKLITVINNRRMRYENSESSEKYNITKLSEAQKIANEFLLQNQFDTRDMQLTHMRKEDDLYILNFSKIYDGVIIERSYTNFVINNSGVVSMDRLWLNVTDKSDAEIYLIPAAKALLSLLDDEEYYGRTVTNIDECYYFDPEEQGYVEDITKAQQGRAIPAWRIQFSDGENIAIDNY